MAVVAARVWVLEVLAGGAWVPTSTICLTQAGGKRIVADLNKENGKVDYRVSLYERTP